MKNRIRRILIYILMSVILVENTFSVSAAGIPDAQTATGYEAGMLLGENSVKEVSSTEEVVLSGNEEDTDESVFAEESMETDWTEEETTVQEESVASEESVTSEESIEEESITSEESKEEENFASEEMITQEDADVEVEEIFTEEEVNGNVSANAVEVLEVEEGNEAEFVSLLAADTSDGVYLYLEAFASLQQAFAAIDELDDSSKYYRIELADATEGVVTSLEQTLTFPTKAAGLTIAADEELTEPVIYFRGNLALKCNTVFEEIVFAPVNKASLILGNYSLTLSKCFVAEEASGFGAVTGSGVDGISRLILDDTQLRVLGAVNKVGTVVFSSENTDASRMVNKIGYVPFLWTEGKVNIGNILLESDGILTGTATVTRKNGKITKVVPQITIAEEVTSDCDAVLYLDLNENVNGVFSQVDFDSEEAEDIQKAGIYLAKATRVSYPAIRALQRNEEETLVKTAGYLTYYATEYGVVLSFLEDGVEKEIPCRTFADAVTEINRRKIKREYVITLTRESAVLSGVRQDILAVTPKTLTMPNKKYVSSLVIQADPDLETEKTALLGFMGNLTFTSDVTLRNVELVQMVKAGDTYVPVSEAKDDYAAAVTVKTGGYKLAFSGEVTINAPVVLNGGNKGSLVFERGSSFTTLTNDLEKTYSDRRNSIYGSVTGFDKVTVSGCDLRISEYRTARKGKYKASSNKVNTLELTDAKVEIIGENAVASLNVKNLLVENAEVYVGGKLNITNATLEGTQKASLFADRDFVISGTLTSKSNNATLFTRLRAKGKASYLTVSGKVIREDGIRPIYVGVYNWITAPETIRNDAVVLTNAPKVSAQLLTAKKASAMDFRPLPKNYSAGSGEYHNDNTSGYMMMKSGSNIYVYEGSKVKVAVYVKHTPEEEGNGELFGFFPSFKEATAAVNAKKDKSAYYTYVMTERNGTVSTPISIVLPTQVKQVTVTSIPGCNESMKTLTFTGKVTLGANTVFKDVIFAPVSKAKGTVFSIAAGGNDLTLEGVSVSEQLKKAALKDISGNGKQTIVLDSPNLHLTGAVTKANKLVIKESTRIDGAIKASLLRLENNDEGRAVTLDAKGNVTLTDLENVGEMQNILSYTRSSKNITNLTINGYIYNAHAGLPVILKQDESKEIATIAKKGGMVVLSAATKAVTMPKASTDSFVLDIHVKNEKAVRTVKAQKGIYLVDAQDNELTGSFVRLVSEKADGSTETDCLDYTQAVNEINNRSDRNAEYTIYLGMAAGAVSDTNLSDGNKVSAFPMPKKNTKASLNIRPEGEEAAEVSFTGAITAYGDITLKNLVLHPVKTALGEVDANVKISANADATGTIFCLERVTTKSQVSGAQSKVGYISDVNGTKNKTQLVLKECDELFLTSGINNVKRVSLEGTKILSAKDSNVSCLELDEVSAWIVLGKFTLTNVSTPQGVIQSYVGVKQDAKELPQLSINGSVDEGMLLVRLFDVDTTTQDGFALFALESEKEIDSYLNVSLALAPKTEASTVRAYAYRVVDENGTIAENGDGVEKTNFASFKDEGYIKNGTQESMFMLYGADKLRALAEQAGQELKEIAQDKILYALIYMTDSYEVKEAPSHEAETVATLQSGHTVQVLGTDVEWKYSSNEDEYLPTVWYEVQFYVNDTLHHGYVEESFLAYSDEMLLQWKQDWNRLFPFENSINTAGIMSYSDVDQFPSDYGVYLTKLKEAHPNWTFVPMNVGRDWDACVNEQMGDYSWIYYNQPAEFRGAQINSSWYYASRAGIEYYMDPRNFLTESDIFQFEQNTYNASYHTQGALQNFLNNTFMAGKVPGDSQGRTYANVIWNSGKTRGLSPFNLAARVIQEQGVNGTSSMISGTYPGYEGYYNHYNIQASGKTDEEVIRNGLTYAKKMGWNTRVKSLNGGADFIGNGYILQGQDTLYLQKFDIEHGSGSLHQYMQNIMAPYSEGRSMKKMYDEAGSLNSSFVFKIPVFNNMPGADYTLSPTSVKIEKGKTKQLTLKCGGVKVLAETAKYTSSNTKVATVSKSGLITAVNSGNAVITATIGEGERKLELTCKVKVYVPLKSISLDVAETSLYVAEGLPDRVAVLQDGVTVYLDKEDCPTQTDIQVIYNPEDTTDDKTTVWTVENPDVLEVNADTKVPGKAVVVAKAGGTTKIMAKVGKFTETVSVTVRVPMTEASLKLESNQITLHKGEKTRINVSYAPYDTTDSIDPVWTSADESVAVIVDGEIVAVGPGTTNLYATVGPFVGSQEDVAELRCKIMVKEYAVTFMDAGGNVLLKATGEYGKPLAALTANGEIPWQLQKDGFVFAGWYTEPDGQGVAIDENAVLHEDLVLYPYFIDVKEGFYAKPIGEVSYTGAYLKPEVTVYSGEKVLIYGTDYTVTYVNNKSVNDKASSNLRPTALIYGKGSYSGKECRVYFDIIPKDISHTDVTAKNLIHAYTGKEQQMRPVLYDGGRILQRDLDYTLSYAEDTLEEGAYLEAGTYAVEVSGIGNYTGSRVIHLTISKRTLMSEVTVGNIPDMKFNNGKKYTSEEQITECVSEKITVTYKGNTLKENTDYTVAYENNKEVGVANVILTGMGEYVGTVVKSFAITGTSLETVTVKGVFDVEYTGEVAKPDSSKIKLVAKNGLILREGLDYTLDVKRITAGTAYVTATGINGYFGTVKKSFKIKPYDIALNSQTYPVEGENVEKPAFEIRMDDSTVEYDKAGAKKEVEVSFKGRTLTEGVDYKLSYKNTQSVVNEEGVEPTVEITGIGNFTGVVSRAFTLTKKDFTKVTMSVKDVTFRNKKGFCFAEPVLVDESGRYLKAGKDYDEEFVYTYEKDTVLYNGQTRAEGEEVLEDDIPIAGSVIRITVTGKENYAGTIWNTFEVLENSSWSDIYGDKVYNWGLLR